MKSFLEWFKAGTKVKRWIFLIILGVILTCYGFTQVLTRDVVEVSEVVKIIIEFVLRFCFYNSWNNIYPKEKFGDID